MAERMDHGKMHPKGSTPPVEREPIPGERDATTQAPTDKGIVGTTGYGGDLPHDTSDATPNPDDVRRNRWEGGGKTK